MERIKELLREKKKLERALLIMLILPLPGIGIGLLIQIKKVDRMIEAELKKLDNKSWLLILSEKDKNEENK